jgi:DNA end-binding protein Ku
MAAARPTWKGSLRLSLISIPIRVFPATSSSSDVSFRQLHRKCHTPIQLKKWCPHCEEEVSSDDIVKGYESSKGHFVLVEEEEIAKLRPESTRTVDLSHIIDAKSIDPIYIERSYYLTPDTKVAGSAFAVMREALEGQAAIGRLALHGREYLVAVLPRDDAFVLHTLRTAGEVRELSALPDLDFADARTKPEEVRLARQVLSSLKTARDLTAFTDHYEDALREMIARKGAGATVAAEGASPTKVVDLMQALRQSLASVESDNKRKPARASTRHKARVIAHPATAGRKTRKAG